ncbi:MAG TPA: LytR C-terminal domain-containing protein, partial [Frankiaceae bacterium]|nr:LytR C-terminal domain-containing protein [Frankiaceae bacterium]
TVPPGSVAAPGGPLVGEPDRSAPPTAGGASGPAGLGAGSSTGAGPPTGARSAGGRAFAPVVVYNNSRLAGLGARAAAVVRAAGFEVKLVSGLPARVSVTTVYYDPPDQAAAQTLIGLVPGIARALPRPSWLLRTGTLILVVTRDFPVDP